MRWLLAFLLAFAPAMAADLYVGVGGSGTTCSDGVPCLMDEAISQLTAGDTIYVKAGTHTTGWTAATMGASPCDLLNVTDGSIVLDDAVNHAGVTITAAVGAGVPILDGADIGIVVDGVANVTISSLEITPTHRTFAFMNDTGTSVTDVEIHQDEGNNASGGLTTGCWLDSSGGTLLRVESYFGSGASADDLCDMRYPNLGAVWARASNMDNWTWDAVYIHHVGSILPATGYSINFTVKNSRFIHTGEHGLYSWLGAEGWLIENNIFDGDPACDSCCQGCAVGSNACDCGTCDAEGAADADDNCGGDQDDCFRWARTIDLIECIDCTVRNNYFGDRGYMSSSAALHVTGDLRSDGVECIIGAACDITGLLFTNNIIRQGVTQSMRFATGNKDTTGTVVDGNWYGDLDGTNGWRFNSTLHAGDGTGWTGWKAEDVDDSGATSNPDTNGGFVSGPTLTDWFEDITTGVAAANYAPGTPAADYLRGGTTSANHCASTDINGDTRPTGVCNPGPFRSPFTTFYVDNNGGCAGCNDEAGCGDTLANACDTIQYVFDTYDLVGGDTVAVQDGTYGEQVTIAESGYSGSPITIQGESQAGTIIDGTAVSLVGGTDIGLVNTVAEDYITIKDLTIRDSDESGFSAANGSSYIVLDNVLVDNNDTFGALFLNNGTAAYSQVINSTFNNANKSCVQLQNNSGGYYLIEDVTCADHAGDSDQDGIQVLDTHHVFIRDVTLTNCATSVAGAADCVDIGGDQSKALPGDLHHVVVDGVDVNASATNSAGWGIALNNRAEQTIVRNSKVYASGFDFKEPPFDEVAVYNNTTTDGVSCFRFYNGDGNPVSTPYGDVVLRNNLCILATSSSERMLHNWNQDYGDPGILEDYNLWNEGVGSPVNVITWRNTEYGSHAAFIAVETDQGANSVDDATAIASVVNNPSALDYSLPTGSPAIEAGGPVASVTQATSSGTQFTVDNWWAFYPGWFTGVSGDTIVVGTDTVTITAIDEGTGQLTVTPSFSWTNGDPVYLPYTGSAPNIGAEEAVPEKSLSGVSLSGVSLN